MTDFTSGNGPVSVVRVVQAPRSEVWRHLEDDQLREKWWPGAHIDFSQGGTISASRSQQHFAQLEGHIDVLVVGHAAGFVWSQLGEQFQTSVLISLQSQEHQAKLNIVELGFDALNDPLNRAGQSEEAWNELMDALEKALEGS